MDATHLDTVFDQSLESIEILIASMGGRVERQILEASDALHTRDAQRAEEVVESDVEIDRLRSQIDADIMRLIAERQPKEQDLHMALGALKVAASLERIGDYAKNMAKRTGVISQSPPVGSATATLKRISGMVQSMLKDVLDAYVAHDIELANDVRLRDEEVDHIYNSQFRELLTHMIEDPRSITPCMHLMFIAKNLERMGDHITGIAEQVHFMATGEYPEEERPKVDQTGYSQLNLSKEASNDE